MDNNSNGYENLMCFMASAIGTFIIMYLIWLLTRYLENYFKKKIPDK